MAAWESYSYAFGPLVAFGLLVVLVLLLRWTFAHGRSLVSRRPATGAEDESKQLDLTSTEARWFVKAVRHGSSEQGLAQERG